LIDENETKFIMYPWNGVSLQLGVSQSFVGHG
jgi:hypothetical protein